MRPGGVPGGAESHQGAQMLWKTCLLFLAHLSLENQPHQPLSWGWVHAFAFTAFFPLGKCDKQAGPALAQSKEGTDVAQWWVCTCQHAAQVGCVEEGTRTGSRTAQLSEHLRLRIPFQGRLLRPREEPTLPLENPYPIW